tara:strand:+ start:14505 stop:15221 length:717 start_codon:yes stop_codon:yes gene_type:complete
MSFSRKQFLQGFVGRAREYRSSNRPTIAEDLRSQLPENGQSAWINPIAAEFIDEIGPDFTGVEVEGNEYRHPRQRGLQSEDVSLPEPVVVNDLVEEALQLLQARIEGIQLSVSLTSEMEWRVEPIVLEGILTSLIGYAASSVPDGGGIIRIQGARGEDGASILELAFNGSAEELITVFGPTPGRLIDSNGKLLVRPGLVATKETVRANHGQIGADRLKGWGANVWFSFDFTPRVGLSS